MYYSCFFALYIVMSQIIVDLYYSKV